MCLLVLSKVGGLSSITAQLEAPKAGKAMFTIDILGSF